MTGKRTSLNLPGSEILNPCRADQVLTKSAALGTIAMKFHHVGIVVENIERSAAQYRQLFGLEPISAVVIDPVQRVNVQFLASHGSTASVELVEPLPGESPARGALKKGGGLNHVCFEVTDIEKSVRQAELEGVLCVCRPVQAAAFDGRRIAFLFYRGIGLVEFVEAVAE
jgi:methylmalonyl-CoA/ethylmalonyl-CoA epimerase